MADAAHVITWNGTDVPPELSHTPPGRYRLVAVDTEDFALTEALAAKIERGRADVREGRTVAWESVKADITATLTAHTRR